MKRTPLISRVPLQRTGGLARSALSSTKRIARKPMKRMASYTGPDAKTRAVVAKRDGGRCVRCAAPATQIHHRRSRGRGGSSDPAINSPANLLTLCGSGTTGCHGWVESNRREAEIEGYIVRHGARSPGTVPVRIFTPLVFQQWTWVLLGADGSKDRCEVIA
jgi:5-methylcytosine-specific restriction protein A